MQDVKSKTSSEGGDTSISHTDNTVPAISLESRDDVMKENDDSVNLSDSKDTTNSEKVNSLEQENTTLQVVIRTLYSKGKEFTSKLFQRSFFDVAQTPKFMQDLGLRGDKFTIKYGVISRHLGKDSSHTLTERDWERLPQALQNPFAISKLTDKNDAYRIYTTLQTENGEFIVVGVDVKSVGREIEVNAISTVFGRRNNANLPQNEDVIYKSKEITLEQSALLERPNFVQYPIIQEFSDGKDTTNSKKVNSLEQENTNATKNKNAEWSDIRKTATKSIGFFPKEWAGLNHRLLN